MFDKIAIAIRQTFGSINEPIPKVFNAVFENPENQQGHSRFASYAISNEFTRRWQEGCDYFFIKVTIKIFQQQQVVDLCCKTLKEKGLSETEARELAELKAVGDLTVVLDQFIDIFTTRLDLNVGPTEAINPATYSIDLSIDDEQRKELGIAFVKSDENHGETGNALTSVQAELWCRMQASCACALDYDRTKLTAIYGCNP